MAERRTPTGTAWGRAARRLARRPTGARILHVGYEAVARSATAVLAAVPGVRSVHVTGSMARPERLAPGHSDIDLTVVVAAANPRAELRVRQPLAEVHRRLGAFGGLFYNLDYVREEELDLVLGHGGRWARDFATASRTLHGPPLPPISPREQNEQRDEGIAAAMRRWRNTGMRLLDPTLSLPPDERARPARRLWQDVVDPAPDGVSRTAPAAPDEALIEALERIDRLAAERTEGWTDAWRTHGHASPPAASPALRALEHAARREGFSGVALHACGPAVRERIAVVVGPSPWSARECVERFRRVAMRSPEAWRALEPTERRPVLLTHAMYRASAFMPPAPLSGACLAAAPLHRSEDLRPPPAPPEPIVRRLATVRAVEGLVTIRGFRRAPGERRRRAVAEQLTLVTPALLAAAAGHAVPVSWSAEPPTFGTDANVDRLEGLVRLHELGLALRRELAG
ncbi:MAG: hypothetical protein ACOCV4_00220 [Myxococcota bacterium]